MPVEAASRNARWAASTSAPPSTPPTWAPTIEAPAIEPVAASSCAGVSPASAEPSPDAYSDAVIEPTTATPRTPPTSRAALFIAAPVEACACGTQLMRSSVAGAMTKPMPAATGIVAAM